MIDATKLDLNAPAFGEGAQKLEDVSADTPKVEAPAEPEKEPEPKEEVPVTEEETEDSDEKPRVTYSRFKNVNDARREAEAEAEKWRQRALEIESTLLQRQTQESPADMPEAWVRLYGDSPEAKEAWKIQQEQNEKLVNEAREAAIKAVESQREAQAEQEKENLNLLDEHLDSISAVAGRDLSSKEQDALLTIIDDFTPKDSNGNYAGALISPDKAWEIYEMKNQAKSAPQKQARDSVAQLTSPHTEGQPDGDRAEKDKNWNPLSWSFLKDVK